MLDQLKEDKNFYLVDSPLNLLSVFDHTRYDRSDLDLLSVPQRQYVERKLKKFGYKFKTGRVLTSKLQTIVFRIPKQSIISANPFDVVRYEKKNQLIFSFLLQLNRRASSSIAQQIKAI